MKTVKIGKNNYEINFEDSLGSGAYGNIYKIINKNDKKEYVLKRLKKIDPKNPKKGETEEEYYKSERDFLKNIKGANIIKMFDYDEDEKYYYFVLEKMEGDLQQMLEKYKDGMPSNIIKKIFSQINSGLKVMINKGMCHRDLKPSNILYSYTNKEKTDFIIKICDFGLTTDLGNATQFDKTNAGTPNYRAPEVETGEYNNICDLYSIGIILYMLKTGEYIFEGKTNVERANNQFQNKFKKETDDKLLNDLIKKLVVYERKDRIDWDDYFKHPFFKDNENESKINYKQKIIKFIQIIKQT